MMYDCRVCRVVYVSVCHSISNVLYTGGVIISIILEEEDCLK